MCVLYGVLSCPKRVSRLMRKSDRPTLASPCKPGCTRSCSTGVTESTNAAAGIAIACRYCPWWSTEVGAGVVGSEPVEELPRLGGKPGERGHRFLLRCRRMVDRELERFVEKSLPAPRSRFWDGCPLAEAAAGRCKRIGPFGGDELVDTASRRASRVGRRCGDRTRRRRRRSTAGMAGPSSSTATPRVARATARRGPRTTPDWSRRRSRSKRSGRRRCSQANPRLGLVRRWAPTVIQPVRAASDALRTSEDAGYGVRQLVDVALRALSPGINDPTTAQDAIFHLGAVLVHRLSSSLAHWRISARTIVVCSRRTH